MSGFYFDEGVLSSVAEGMHTAASGLSTAVAAEVGAVDAGTTSDAVSAALERILVAGDASARTLSDVGDAVNASKGSYAHIENNNVGLVELSTRGHLDFPGAQSGPLVNAHDRNPTLPTPGRR